MFRKDKLDCYKQIGGSKIRCFSCSSLACSFSAAPITPTPPSAPVVEVIGRLEGLRSLEADVKKADVLRWCVDRLRGETGVKDQGSVDRAGP